MVEERQHTAYADLAGVYLDDDELARVLAETMECVLNWTTADGWPVGMVHGFVADDRPHLWMTCAAARKRVAAIERDARVSVVVNAPSPVMGAGRSAVFKGRCTIHRPGDDGFADVAAWFYPALAAKAYEREAYDGSVKEAVWRTVKAGCFAIGILILATQIQLNVEFAARGAPPPQLGDSPETDLVLNGVASELIADAVFEAVGLIAWRTIRCTTDIPPDEDQWF